MELNILHFDGYLPAPALPLNLESPIQKTKCCVSSSWVGVEICACILKLMIVDVHASRLVQAWCLLATCPCPWEAPNTNRGATIIPAIYTTSFWSKHVSIWISTFLNSTQWAEHFCKCPTPPNPNSYSYYVSPRPPASMANGPVPSLSKVFFLCGVCIYQHWTCWVLCVHLADFSCQINVTTFSTSTTLMSCVHMFGPVNFLLSGWNWVTLDYSKRNSVMKWNVPSSLV